MENKIELITRDSLNKSLENKQDKISPGRGVTISESNEISFDINEATRYSAGENIFIDSENRIHARFNIPQPDGDQLPPSIPPAELEAPNPIMNFRAEFNSDRIVLNWDLPEDDKLAGVKIIRNNYKYPTSINDGYGVYEGKDNTFTDMEIKNSGSVYYRAFTFNRRKVFNPDATQITKSIIKLSQSKPDIPTAKVIGITSIILNTIENGEYKVNDGPWQSDPTFNGLLKNTEYRFKQRKAETSSNFHSEESDELIISTKNSFLYTVVIDTGNSHPENSCTYADDAINFTPLGKDIEDNLGYYPCLLDDGIEREKLKKEDFNYNINGRRIDFENGSDGDIVIAFPCLGYKIEKLGNKIKVSVTNEMDKEGFCYKPFENNGVLKEKIYISALPLKKVNNSLRSLSGVRGMPETVQVIKYDYTVNRNYYYLKLLQANSLKYKPINFYHHIFLQCLAIITFKRLDISAVTGGKSYYGSEMDDYYSGTSKQAGMNHVPEDNKKLYPMKILGIELFTHYNPLYIHGLLIYKDKIYNTTKDYELIGDTPRKDDWFEQLKQDNPSIKEMTYSNSQHGNTFFITDVAANNDFGFLPVRETSEQEWRSSNNKYFASAAFISGHDSEGKVLTMSAYPNIYNIFNINAHSQGNGVVIRYVSYSE